MKGEGGKSEYIHPLSKRFNPVLPSPLVWRVFMQKRHQRWTALLAASGILFASLGSLAAIRDHSQTKAAPAKVQRVAPILIPTAMEHAVSERLVRAATQAEIGRLEALQEQLGVYRPWKKAGE